MKSVLGIFCWVLAVFALVFPFAYKHSLLDRKEVKVSHILVNTYNETLDIQERLKEGSPFEVLARDFSICPSAGNDGDLGYNPRGKFVKEFEDTAFKLPLNKVSEPIRTSYGWHLIKVTDIKYFSDKENLGKKSLLIKL